VAPVLGAAVAIFCWGLRPFDWIAGWATKGRAQSASPARSREVSAAEIFVWAVTGIAASLSHLAADVVFSGNSSLADWELKLLWPMSNRGWVCPLVPWGDVGATLIFIAGMFAMARFRQNVQSISCATLLLVAIYIVLRGSIGG